MAKFPGALPDSGTAVTTDTLAMAGHTSLHNTGADEARAIATKIGTGASTPTSGMLLRGNGAGTSVWAQVTLTSDVTGVLPQANGGTGTTLATGTGKAVYDTSPTLSTPTLTTPTIASFTNANHSHQNAAGGGTLGAAALPALDLSLQTLYNPYKFYVYRNAAWTDGNAAFAKVSFDTKVFDTSSNYDATTNFRFNAPIAGFYYVTAQLSSTVTLNNLAASAIYKNGSAVINGLKSAQGGATTGYSRTISGLLQLAANDYLEAYSYGTGGAGDTGANATYFMGYLVSTT